MWEKGKLEPQLMEMGVAAATMKDVSRQESWQKRADLFEARLLDLQAEDLVLQVVKSWIPC